MEFENVLDDFLGDKKLNIFLFKNVKVVAWWSPRMVAINVCNAQESGLFHGHLVSSYKAGSGFWASMAFILSVLFVWCAVDEWDSSAMCLQHNKYCFNYASIMHNPNV